MSIDFLFSSFAIAGIAVLWRNLIKDHPLWETAIKKALGTWNKLLLCGSCFTYWLSLIFLLIHNPLAAWAPDTALPVRLFITWMALAFAAVSFRFGYVYLQEKVHHLVHSTENHSH